MWTPPTVQEDLPRSRPDFSCHPSFDFGFRFLVIAPVSWMVFLPLFSTSPVMSMFATNCYQKLVDNPGTTSGTKVSVLQIALFPCLVNRGFRPLTHSWEYPWSSQSLPSDGTAGVSSSDCTVMKRWRSWTNTCASSWFCTSPLAVNTTVGVLYLLLCPSLLSFILFLLIICIDAPESTTTSRSSGFVEASAGITFASTRVYKVVLSEFLGL